MGISAARRTLYKLDEMIYKENSLSREYTNILARLFFFSVAFCGELWVLAAAFCSHSRIFTAKTDSKLKNLLWEMIERINCLNLRVDQIMGPQLSII